MSLPVEWQENNGHKLFVVSQPRRDQQQITREYEKQSTTIECHNFVCTSPSLLSHVFVLLVLAGYLPSLPLPPRLV